MVWGWTCTSRGRCWHTSYLSFFLHICNFWFNFSPHKSAWIMTKHICDKQHKLQQNRFTTKQHRFYILSSSYICHRRRNLRFLHLWNCSTCGETSDFSTSVTVTFRNLKFLHMTDFFSTDILVILVTNMRYGCWVEGGHHVSDNCDGIAFFGCNL